jgi:hypothetical protein
MTLDPQWTALGGLVLLLCVGGIILSVVLPAIASLLSVVGGFLEFFLDILTGGPVAWCGCLVVVILLVGCCVIVALAGFTLSTCGTPNAVNFCQWFGL